MKSKLFIKPNLRKEIEKNIEKRTRIEEEIRKNIKEFYNQVDPTTIYEIINQVVMHGHPQQRNLMLEIKERYEKGQILIDDTLQLLDYYEKVTFLIDDKVESESDKNE